MFRWSGVDYATQQPKLVSVCIELLDRQTADRFDITVQQAVLSLSNEEFNKRGKRPTYGVGDAVLPRPRVILFCTIPYYTLLYFTLTLIFTLIFTLMFTSDSDTFSWTIYVSFTEILNAGKTRSTPL